MRALGYILLSIAALVILPWDYRIIPGPMLRNTTRTPADEPQDTASYTRKLIMFPCSGVKCQAWLYLPKGTEEKPPIVVAAHGIGCQKDFTLAHYGDRFAKAGLASFIFDYRSFGGSEGEPRHWVSPRKHVEDYMSAVQFIKAELSEAVAVNRINLWGTSFSGGHVLTLAGTRLRDNVTAVVAQVPHTDGLVFLTDNLKRRPLVVVRAFLASLHDTLRSLFNYPPAYVALTGDPGSFSVLDVPAEEAQLFYALHPKQRQGGWRNMIRAEFVLQGLLYRPIKHVHNIKAPVLYIAATEDSLFRVSDIEAALHRTPDGQLQTVKGGHFSVYGGLQLPFCVQHMVAFLREKNGMKPMVMSGAEAAGLGRTPPTAAHKSAGADAAGDGQEERADATAEL